MNYPEPPSGHSMYGAHHVDTPPEHAREELYSKAPPHPPKKSTIRDCKPRNLDPLDFAPHPINYYNRLRITTICYSSFHFHFLFHSPKAQKFALAAEHPGANFGAPSPGSASQQGARHS